MKKLALSLAVLFSMAMVSCGGNKAAEATDSETIVEEAVEVVADSNDTTVVAEAEAEVAPVADSAK